MSAAPFNKLLRRCLMKLRRTMTMLAVTSSLLVAGPSIPQANQARLFITPVGQGRYLVVVDGHGPRNASVGIRVRGEDPWFDDSLFSFGFFSHSGPDGSFNVSTTVSGSALNEDWGEDEVYAIAGVGNTSIRTNTVHGSF
jgi:hypothetical protein